MASIMKHICLLVFLSLICKDVCGDDLIKLTIHQEPTSAPGEWKVTLTNETPCSIERTYLDCTGFQSRIEIDPKVISKQGDACLVKGLGPKESTDFIYVWDNQFPFKQLNNSVACS